MTGHYGTERHQSVIGLGGQSKCGVRPQVQAPRFGLNANQGGHFNHPDSHDENTHSYVESLFFPSSQRDSTAEVGGEATYVSV